MGFIVCNGKCDSCDFEHWMHIKKKKILAIGNSMRGHDCSKVMDDEL